MDTASLLDARNKPKRKKFLSSISAALVIVLTMTVIVTAQPQPDESVKKISAQGNLPLPGDYATIFGSVFANPRKDPPATLGDCASLNLNSILLIDRSLANRNMFTPEVFDKYIMGLKLYLMRISSAARARNAQAHIIIGAYGTYNVWQNIPGGVRDAAWRDSIDISDTDNLKRQLDIIDSIYFVTSWASPAHIGDPERGYLGGEAARANVTRFQDNNIDDALVQSAREISRWTNGAATTSINGDMDLVMVVSSGQPNVNNGPTDNKFPASNRIFRPTPFTPLFPLLLSTDYFSWGTGPWDQQAFDDTWRPRETVNALRTGAAISYTDVRDNGRPLSDSSPVRAGARPPVRVFGETIVPSHDMNGVVLPAVYNMTRIFGWEWADYDTNPPTLAVGDTTAIIESHRHFDKSFGNIEENEIVSDMMLPIRDMLNPIGGTPPCPATSTVDAPNLTITVEEIPPIVEGTQGLATIHITNNGNTLQNVEVRGDTNPVTQGPVANMVPHQYETTSRDPACPQYQPSGFILPCHYTVLVEKGKKYTAGQRIGEEIAYFGSGETITLTRVIDSPSSASVTAGRFNVYVNATLDYDHTSMVAANVPDATWLSPGVLDPVRNNGFFWGSRFEPIEFLPLPYPV